MLLDKLFSPLYTSKCLIKSAFSENLKLQTLQTIFGALCVYLRVYSNKFL